VTQQIDPEVALEVAATLQDWIPMSDTRALRWATDLLEQRAAKNEAVLVTARRINEAAKRCARGARDIRYHDVFATVCWLIKRDIEEAQRAKQDLERTALPAVTGGLRTGNIAVGIFTDIAARLIPADAYEQELEIRRGLSDAEIIQRRRELEIIQRGRELAGARGAA
jgi:hypothetical protein